MERYCEVKDFSDESMKKYGEMLEVNEDKLEEFCAKDNVVQIWNEICKKELVEKADAFSIYGMVTRNIVLPGQNFEVGSGSSVKSEIVTEIEENSRMKIEFVRESRQSENGYGVEQKKCGIQSKGSNFLAEVLMLLISGETLYAILQNIKYSEQCYEKKENYEMLDLKKDSSFMDSYQAYRKKGSDRKRKEKHKLNAEADSRKNPSDVVDDFVTVTNVPLPVTCGFIVRAGNPPMIAGAAPNVFRFFIENREFANKYKNTQMGSLEKYRFSEMVDKDVKAKSNFNFCEEYLWEKIVNVPFCIEISNFLSQLFQGMSCDSVEKCSEDIGKFVQALLGFPDNCVRFKLLRLLKEKYIRWEDMIVGPSQKNKDIKRVQHLTETVLFRLTEMTKYINDIQKTYMVYYKSLYRELLYILWMKTKNQGEKKSIIGFEESRYFAFSNKKEKQVTDEKMYQLIQRSVMLNSIL